ncbi:MAG TPA: bifunctional glutamate N-acetyltransferase/amino-acid acetyltransferase ArgJ [Candidatus Limiplasma merdipullorum]|nr:bifunctional glutamate N-acetyltransferase/amino-acid acetyltransferase ArgJ [Candidatus Limiplasma merdipullorum]
MSEITFIAGGATAAQGFSATGEHMGIRRNRTRRDVALIVSEIPANAACVYTQNLVKGAPILVTQKHVENGIAQAVICNSGNANTCNANGVEIAEGMCALVEKYIGVKAEDVIVASTGVIGQPMTLEPFQKNFGKLADSLEDTPAGGTRAAEAIMTTDTVSKEVAVRFPLGGKMCKLGGISKGSGMIAPNMATMLCFLTTDAAISPVPLKRALTTVTADTFNMLSIDGDTSTNDMVSILANGMAGNTPIESCMGADYEAFVAALYKVCEKLCAIMAKDGEGATKLLVCEVTGAKSTAAAKLVAKAVIKSTLLKAAIFGADANWGRVLCAIGYAGADVDVSKVDVNFRSNRGLIPVCRGGAGVAFSEETAKEILMDDEITVQVALNSGSATAKAWGCDLTYDYVKINGDYRT